MKEQLHLIPIESGLTNQSQNPYSRGGPRFNRGGENFMAEPGQGETQPPVGAEQPQPRRSLSAAEARRITRENLGRFSIGGGDEGLPTTGNAVLDAIVHLINNSPQQIGKPDFLERQSHKIQDAIVEGKVPADQARQILEVLEGWQIEARSRIREAEEEFQAERGGYYGERRLTTAQRKEIEDDVNKLEENPKSELEQIDILFERMFERPDARPRDSFREIFGSAGGIEDTDLLNALLQIKREAIGAGNQKRADIVQRLIDKYAAEFKLRQLLHDAYYVAEAGLDVKDFAGHCAQFAAEFADLTFLDAPEVESAGRLREQVLLQIKRENNNWIPYEKVAWNPETKESELEVRTRDRLRELNDKGFFGKVLPERKIARALSLSRGFGMVTLRLPEIIAECTLSVPPAKYEAQKSIPWETIAWELNPLDHKFKRYSIGDKLRALLYINNKKRKWWEGWDQKELEEMLSFDAVTNLASVEGVDRMVDIRNLSRIGGPLTYTGWRMWVSALEDGKLKQVLKDSPGLAVKLLFNRYNIKDLTERRDRFIKEHPDWSDAVLAQKWEELEKGIKEKEKTQVEPEWKKEDLKAWADSAERIPHVLLRILIDPSNRLLDEKGREALLKDIFGERDFESKEFQKLYTQTENDLTLAKEHMLLDKNRRNALDDSDWEVIEKEGGRGRKVLAQKLQDEVKKKLGDKDLGNRIFQKIKDRSFPFAITAEDIRWGDYRFIQTGGRGFVTRRINDFYQEVQANQELINLVVDLKAYRAPEQIVEQLNKIFKLAAVHDKDRAADLVKYLAKGIIRLYQKDWFTKTPIIGELWSITNAFRQRGNSFAQTAYGGRAMEWDADSIYNFTEQLRQILSYEEINELREGTGGRWWQAIAARGKMALYIFILFFLYNFAKKTMEEK